MNITKPIAAAVIVGTLILGAGIGAIADRFYISKNIHAFIAKGGFERFGRHADGRLHPGPMMPPPGSMTNTTERAAREKEHRDRMMKDFTDAMSLSKSQQESIDALFKANRSEMEAIRDTFFKNMESTFSNTDNAILSVLDEKQRGIFSNKFIGRRGPRPGGRPSSGPHK
ncbi:MAG: hypothetical protein HZC28_12280 [Spirochaetes bacterium]|nr:hypothetical protein [Spirochaetota bacterium]